MANPKRRKRLFGCRTQRDAAEAMLAAIAELHARHAHETRALQTELHEVSRGASARGGGDPHVAVAHTAAYSSSGLMELQWLRQALEGEFQQQSARHVAAQQLNQHRLEQLFSKQVRKRWWGEKRRGRWQAT